MRYARRPHPIAARVFLVVGLIYLIELATMLPVVAAVSLSLLVGIGWLRTRPVHRGRHRL